MVSFNIVVLLALVGAAAASRHHYGHQLGLGDFEGREQELELLRELRERRAFGGHSGHSGLGGYGGHGGVGAFNGLNGLSRFGGHHGAGLEDEYDGEFSGLGHRGLGHRLSGLGGHRGHYAHQGLGGGQLGGLGGGFGGHRAYNGLGGLGEHYGRRHGLGSGLEGGHLGGAGIRGGALNGLSRHNRANSLGGELDFDLGHSGEHDLGALVAAHNKHGNFKDVGSKRKHGIIANTKKSHEDTNFAAGDLDEFHDNGASGADTGILGGIKKHDHEDDHKRFDAEGGLHNSKSDLDELSAHGGEAGGIIA